MSGGLLAGIVMTELYSPVGRLSPDEENPKDKEPIRMNITYNKNPLLLAFDPEKFGGYHSISIENIEHENETAVPVKKYDLRSAELSMKFDMCLLVCTMVFIAALWAPSLCVKYARIGEFDWFQRNIVEFYWRWLKS